MSAASCGPGALWVPSAALAATAFFLGRAHAALQGLDLYAEVGERIVTAAEFHATLLADAPPHVQQPWPDWLCGGRCQGWHCAPQNGTTFEVVHHHFAARLNQSARLPNVSALLPALRPTSCWDQLCWETLTHGDAL